ncbi:MAG: DNA internalization-related competence protein ComEC/Rec2 [Cocleimonas sp.]|nr:DNA internalization-related competence protein ComEC/Rec2 [Cocleimonas sp.]
MRVIASGFFFGAFLLPFFSQLPNVVILLCLLLIPLSVFFFVSHPFALSFSHHSSLVKSFALLLISILLSLIYTTITAKSIIDTRLPVEWVGKDLTVEGIITNIPQLQQGRWRFYLTLDHAMFIQNDSKEVLVPLKGKIKLSWYHHKKTNIKTLGAGQKWRFSVRLKQPNSFQNTGGFDYEKWLFSNRIKATGYVRQSTKNNLIEMSPWYDLHHIRQQLATKIKQLSNDNAIITALAVASRDDMSESHWRLFQHTGTSHLIAISGLHIGIVAGFGYLFIAAIWWVFPALYQHIPVRIAGSSLAIVLATLYAFLAGFTLPTQRSLIMVIGFVISLQQRQKTQTLTTLSTAIILILIIDPFATMSASFWLSFAAVLLIWIYANRCQVKPRFSFIWLQLTLSFGMFPLTLFFFGSASLISPLANLIAIPWVTLIIVPLILLAMLLLPVSSLLSEVLLQFVSLNIDYLLMLLTQLDALPFTVLNAPFLSTTLLLVMMLGLLFMLLPTGFPGKWLGLLLFIPLFIDQPQGVQQAAFRYTLLDVGQGLASVVETKHHVLIYDTGPKTHYNFDTGKLVVLPFLRAKGIQKIDKMVLSHVDMDHRGGTLALLSEIKTHEIISSNTHFLDNYSIKNCKMGKKWQWDGVTFEFIYPDIDSLFIKKKTSNNNRSCVLRISNQYHSLLLTGDIEKEAERLLLTTHADKLRSEVLLIPHHGSLTSSTSHFIDAVNPRIALNASGYHNKFKHPANKVVLRYQEKEIPIFDTVNKGELSLLFPAKKTALSMTSYREDNLKFWHRR